jgi:hypothetical protein
MQEIYDLHGYLPEMREAMEKWEPYVQAICIDAPLSIAA